MFDSETLATIALTFLLAGTVKGVIGMGLPTVSLGLLAITLDLTTAMALLIVPAFVTNLWQALAGGNARALLRRIWPFLLTATMTVWIGAISLRRVELPILSGLLGVSLMTYAALGLWGVRLAIPTRWEGVAGPLFGIVNGVLTGMTGSFVVPGVLYLQSIGLTRDRLVQAMGMLFAVSTAALALALEGNDLLTTQLNLTSCIALVPAAAGMVIGQRVRRSIPEAQFRRLFHIAMLLLGVYIVARATFAAT